MNHSQPKLIGEPVWKTFWNRITLWGQAMERTETSVLEDRVIRIEADLRALRSQLQNKTSGMVGDEPV